MGYSVLGINLKLEAAVGFVLEGGVGGVGVCAMGNPRMHVLRLLFEKNVWMQVDRQGSRI